MNTPPAPAAVAHPYPIWKTVQNSPGFRAMARRPELFLFALLVFILNAPLVCGSGWESLIFEAEAVHEFQWWRLLTHPFVHVTWYHLLLDGTAFFILYHSLLEKSACRRLGYVGAAGAGSLAAACLGSDLLGGLCGLSGIAHGLMAVSALELAADPSPAERRVGLVSFAFVVSKAAYEAFSGRMFFSFLDFGMLGSPVSVSHAGGIIGALALLGLFRICQQSEMPLGRKAVV